MNETEMPLGRRLADLAKVLGVFALLGPPIGALTFSAGIGLYFAGETGQFSSLALSFLFGLIYGLPMSYQIGILPAAIAGLLLGAVAVFYRIPGSLLAMAVGILVGIGVVYSGRSRSIDGAFDPVSALILVSTCLVATVLCWAVARRLIPSEPSPPMPAEPGS